MINTAFQKESEQILPGQLNKDSEGEAAVADHSRNWVMDALCTKKEGKSLCKHKHRGRGHRCTSSITMTVSRFGWKYQR